MSGPSRRARPHPTSTGARQALRSRTRRAAAFAALLVLGACAAGLRHAPAVRAALRRHAIAALAARLPSARLVGDVRLDWGLGVVAGPVILPGRAPGEPPAARIERVTLRPRLRALLAGRFQIAAIGLDGVQLDVEGLELPGGPGSAQSTARLGECGLPDIDIAFTRLAVRSRGVLGAAPLEVGPLSGDVRVSRRGPEREATAIIRFPGGGTGEARLRWGVGPAALEARARGVLPDALPEGLRGRLPLEPTGGAFELSIDAPRLDGAGEAGEARVSVAVRGLEVRSAALASEPVGPAALRLAGTLRWGVRLVALEHARVELGTTGGVGAELAFSLRTAPEPIFALDARADALDWEAAMAALPPALAPPPEAPRLRGRVAARLSASGPVLRPSEWRLDGDYDASALEPGPPHAGAVDLSGPFRWRAPTPDGSDRAVLVGPESPDFVALRSLPSHVVRAVTTSEDAAFFGHRGFDLHELQDALARADGRPRLRGASTISQQLAKNLFLSPERTLARKAREALVTVALEASLDKRRLLEIYLNVAHWGSGVFGIGPASRHWFGKDARDLTPKEAAFLATVIPNPVRYEMYRRRGALTERWEARVRDLLLKLRAAEVLDDEQLRTAWDAPLPFAQG